ncbi:815_t:CDS:1 [Scutellospora calospora]|uniref:815_t:CDS:1 n=1 Tax=Scutellospora calospora TaxID=85575 RepID=A0ACA9KR40_9GLOM|nr:815_t:CDS:1 [Scutellospora calospora]
MSQSQPLKLNAFTSISQTLILPIPRTSVPTKHSEMMMSNWPPSSSEFTASSATFPVIPCQQQNATTGPTGKPVPNRRGRKRLNTMPLNKKHKQNLTNQRAFRERREYYLKTLESKVEMYEKAYAQYQTENSLLKEEVAMLKRRLSRFENYAFEGGLSITSSDMQLSDKIPVNKNTNSCCNVVNAIYSVPNMIEDNQINNNQIFHGIDKDDSNERMYIQDYSTLPINNDGSSSFTQKSYPSLPNGNLSSFMQGYDEQSSSKNRPHSPTHSSTSIESVDEITDSSIFTENHNLCFCDDSEINGQSQKTNVMSNPAFSTATRSTLPTPDEPQWPLSHEQYFAQTTLTSSFSQIDNERRTRLFR